ncbi:hypothetical protein [Hyphomicrobium sp. DY-1]|uniref:hypothetical protein n=1 Tax=Hyphomicrobium sp. DY-1 TaxID=3075650 RepID=UPI0039C42DA7
MTAIIVHVGQDEVHVLSDTAVTANDGTVSNFTAKVCPIPHANLVIAVRGHTLALGIAVANLQRAGTAFDEIRANAESALRPVFTDPHPTLTSTLAAMGATPDCEIYVAGISETRGPCAYVMRVTQSATGLDWSIEDIDEEDAMFGPFTPEIADEFEKRCEETGGGRLSNLEWVMDRARGIKSPVFGRGEPVAQVGGHVVMTKITTDRIELRVVKAWPDKLGAKIEV